MDSELEKLRDEDDDDNINNSRWAPEDEEQLLKAVLEMVDEPLESFDPAVSPLDELARTLAKPFARVEVLAKVKELESRYRRTCCKISVGEAAAAESNDSPAVVFETSCKIWGPKMGIVKRKRRKMRTRTRTRKRRNYSVGGAHHVAQSMAMA